MRPIAWLGTLFGIAALVAPALAATPADLSLQRWPDASTTFAQPIAVRAPNDGSGRTFVIERCSGIRIVKNGAVLATPFVSISNSCSSEQGILGMAFDPDFASNGTFYVTYTAPAGDPRIGSSADQVLARYTVSPPSANVANPTGQVILRVPDLAANHNGGDVHFGHDGYLYWSMGDGGAQGDPYGLAQCTGRKKASGTNACYDTSGSGPNYYLMGKIIRLDVHNSTASAPANFCGSTPGQPAPYAIPAANPFADVVQHPNDCAEVFNWGLRNPFRFSFDRLTGDMLIGDVGQGRYEEVSFQPAGSPGQNFQWNQCEGFHTYPGGALGCAGPVGSVPPKIEYPHSGGRCSITGGYRYRGPVVSLQGQYVFSDYCAGQIYIAANPAPNLATWTFETMPGTPSMSSYSFGEDAAGNLFITDGGGKIYQFTGDIGAVNHTVTPSAGVGGTIDPDMPQTVADGSTTSFQVTADTGFHVDSVTGCSGSLSGSTYITGPITADCTVTALFASNPTFIVTPIAGIGGSLSPDQPQTVEAGDSVAFEVEPDPGYIVDTVEGCGGTLVALTFTTAPISANCTVTASFLFDDTIFTDGFDG